MDVREKVEDKGLYRIRLQTSGLGEVLVITDDHHNAYAHVKKDKVKTHDQEKQKEIEDKLEDKIGQGVKAQSLDKSFVNEYYLYELFFD